MYLSLLEAEHKNGRTISKLLTYYSWMRNGRLCIGKKQYIYWWLHVGLMFNIYCYLELHERDLQVFMLRWRETDCVSGGGHKLGLFFWWQRDGRCGGTAWPVASLGEEKLFCGCCGKWLISLFYRILTPLNLCGGYGGTWGYMKALREGRVDGRPWVTAAQSWNGWKLALRSRCRCLVNISSSIFVPFPIML